jgi:hypothetical protein
MENVKRAKWRLATSLAINAQMDSFVLETELHAIERVPANGRAVGNTSPMNGYGKTRRSSVALWDRCFNAYVRWEPCDGRGLVVAYSLLPRTLELSWHSKTLRS